MKTAGNEGINTEIAEVGAQRSRRLNATEQACSDVTLEPSAELRSGYAMESVGPSGRWARIYRAAELFTVEVVPEDPTFLSLHLRHLPAASCEFGSGRLFASSESIEPGILDAIGLGKRSRVDGICCEHAARENNEGFGAAHRSRGIYSLEDAGLGHSATVG